MIPDPLHPAVVHFPMALAALLPFLALGALLLTRRGARAGRVWAPVIGVHALVALSAWASLETGEEQEEVVEHVVSERYIEDHEEAGERFLTMAAIALGISLTGLLADRRGEIGRAASVVGAVALLVMAIQVGRSGGELVYTHGAAQAYVKQANAGGQHAERRHGRGKRHERGHRRRNHDDD